MFRGITNNFETNGADKYNALQMSFQKRTGNGLTFLVSYTLSRYLSNTDSGFSTFNFKGLNPANQAAEWSVGNNDQTHVLTMAGVYELPLGPGRKRSEEHTSELQSHSDLVCRLLLEKKKTKTKFSQ